MSDHPDHCEHKHKHFSVSLFIIIVVSSVSGYFALLALALPSVWERQFVASFTSHLVTFLMCHFCYGIFEHLFHRYVLHMPLIPGLSKYYKSHTKHHGLTPVIYRKVGIKNRYPIIEEKQHEASFFPWYSYLVFVLILTPLFGLAQWIFPTAPIFLEGSLALVFSISLYELVHAVEHYSLEKWLPKLEYPNPYFRKFWRTVYSFHLRHHVDKKCNECISGFFTIPVADFLFGTWVNPNVLYEDGTQVDKREFESPVPVFFIRMIDNFGERVVAKRRQKAA